MYEEYDGCAGEYEDGTRDTSESKALRDMSKSISSYVAKENTQREIEDNMRYHKEKLNMHVSRANWLAKNMPVLGRPILRHETQMIEYHNNILRSIDESNGGY